MGIEVMINDIYINLTRKRVSDNGVYPPTRRFLLRDHDDEPLGFFWVAFFDKPMQHRGNPPRCSQIFRWNHQAEIDG